AWPTVYNELFYAGLCIEFSVTVCTSAPDGTSKCGITYTNDYFNSKRERQYESNAAIPWYDIPPEYAEKELDILRSTVDTLVIYPGSSQYLCYPGSTFCNNGLFDAIWKPYLIWSENMGLVINNYFNAGDSTCLASVTNYFNNGTLQKRREKIAAALQSADELKIVNMRKNDVLPPAEGRFLTEYKSWSDVADKTAWNADELDINIINANWQRRIGSAEEPPYVFEGAGSDTAHVLSIGTWGTKIVKDNDWQIEEDDVDVEILISSDSAVNFDGAIIPFIANASNEDPIYKNWHWIKLARRYISASNSEFRFHTPSSGQKTLIGGIRFKRNGINASKAILWIGNDIQEWLHGHGWSRDASTGGLRFDPAIALAMDNDVNLPFTTEIVALPGRPIDQTYQACVLIESSDQAKPAKITYQVPGKGATLVDHQLETTKKIWAPIHANFSALPNYRQWQIKFIPKPDSGPFIIKKVHFYEGNKAMNQKGGYDSIKAAGICGSYKL
ncbi:MAG: hypothetical protein HYU98_03315, partial [Deltaproteobacteria bacterium]|nr:hypothetical protein [Deltaproteobacteria bacterium]